MAPEPNVLKRKRSRPSDYWIVGANATAQQNDASKGSNTADGASILKVDRSKRARSQPASSKAKPLEDKTNRAQAGRRTKSAGKTAQLEEVGDVVPVGVKKNRGRPSRSKSELVEDNVPRRRGRSSLVKAQIMEKIVVQDGDLDQLAPVEVEPIEPKNKRGQPSMSMSKSKPLEADVPENPRKGGRSAPVRSEAVDELGSKEDGDGDVTSSNTVGQSSASTGSRKKSRQASKQSKATLQHPGTDGEIIAVETASSKLTRGRPRPAVRTVSRVNAPKPATGTTSQSKVPRTSSAPHASSKGGSSRKASGIDNPTSKKKNVSRRSDEKVLVASKGQGRKRKDVEADMPQEPNKRQRVEDEVQHDVELPIRTPYPHLEPTVRRVSRLKIEKWEPLPPGCVDQISTLLQELQKPVIARVKDDRKKSQASVALKSISRKLVKKLSRGLPFPLATGRTREEDFDFERILDNSRALESQLTPAIHANELLEAELRKEMARLESDEQNLAVLEANAKSEAALRNDTSRSIHPLLHGDLSYEASSFQLDVGLEEKRKYQSLDTSITDENLQALIKSLGGHMDSIQGNIKQVDGITESLARTKGAVQARLFDHLDTSQYEAVVLGSDV